MLPDDEYKALKAAHLARQNRPPIPEPVNYYKLLTCNSPHQVPSSAWSDSTASEVGGFRALTNLKKRLSKGNATERKPRVNSRQASSSTSNPNQSAATPPKNLIHPQTEARFDSFDPVAYEAAQAVGRGSIYGAEALLLDERSSTRQRTRPPPVKYVQGRSSNDSGTRAGARQQPQNQLFHISEDTEAAELNRDSAINRLAFSEATQGISYDLSMPLNLGPEHAQYWASREAAMGKVRLQNCRSENPLLNKPRLATQRVREPQDQLLGRGYHSTNTSEAFFVPERTRLQQHQGQVYEGTMDRPQPATSPRKKKNVFKRLWKKIF